MTLSKRTFMTELGLYKNLWKNLFCISATFLC